uniref:Nucleoporin NSP1-like C-terminal domain-containing protein n=1 Tax=Leersia perrieri TaxID=77586 RepID=A0A0D9V7Y5_9ORYZ
MIFLFFCCSPTSTAITPATSQAPRLPSEIVGKNVEQIIRDWNNELQDRTGKFRKHATAIAEWDRRILQNRNVLIRLEAEVAKVVETQTSLERQLELIETHQKELHWWTAGQAEALSSAIVITDVLVVHQGAEFETADSMTPFDVAVRILDNQLRSLMWIDEKANEFSTRIQRLPNNGAAAERDSGMPRFWLS